MKHRVYLEDPTVKRQRLHRYALPLPLCPLRTSLACPIATGAGLLLFLAGCVTTPPRWPAASVSVPAAAPVELAPAALLPERAEAVDMPAQEDQQDALPLTRDGALLTALLHNRSLETAAYDVEIGATYTPEALSAFEPVLTATFTTGRDKQDAGVSATFGDRLNQWSSLSTQVSSLIGTASGGIGSITELETLVQTLSSLEQTAANGEALSRHYVVTRNTQGSIGVSSYLPTGTSVSLSATGTHADNTATDGEYTGGWSLDLRQPLLRGAGAFVNLIAVRQAQNQAAASVLGLRKTVLEIIGETEDAYWNLALAAEVLRIREFAQTLAAEQLQRAQDRFELGKAIQGDVLTARAEYSTRAADLANARATMASENVNLVRLLNPSDESNWKLCFTAVDTPEAEAADIDAGQCTARAMAYRPELAQARLAIGDADLSVAGARNDLRPRLDLIASYGATSSGNTASSLRGALNSTRYDNYQIGIEFETPILRTGQRARLKRAQLAQSQAERALAGEEQAIAAEIHQAVIEVERQQQQVVAGAETVRSREAELENAQGRYNVGKLTTLDLLQVQRDLIQSRLDEATARIGLTQAITRLRLAEGTLLDARGIVLPAL
ncbi:MAG: TolC family protein [Candidatus Hydrogenedentes bacterium]|nr:TolC family protein [Candidatus Hydrogenedentota bacterium]